MIRLLVLTGAIATAATVWAQPACTPAPTFSAPHPAVVRVAVPERDGAAYGSGALVAVNESTGLVVTNWHVVCDAAGPIAVYFPNGFRSPATVLRTDRDWDLAALAIWRPNVQPIAVSNVAPRPGEPLTIAGYGSGSYRAVTGRCTQYVSPGANQPFEMIELSAPARQGDSGGPILNSRGELAGVLFGTAFGRTTGSYCGRLRWFLGSVDVDFQRVSSQALLAQQARRDPPPVAAINSPRPLTGEGQGVRAVSSPLPAPKAGLAGEGQGVRAVGVQPVVELPGYSPNSSPQIRLSGVPASSAASPSVGLLPNTEQIRSILALIGALAILYSALRFLGWAIG